MNKAHLLAGLSGLLLLLSACGEHRYVKNNMPESAEQQAEAECKYQAESSTATIGADDKPKTTGDAISDGVSSGIASAMEQSDLTDDCMEAKGFSR